MKSVLILLSTYNGEKYIKEQLESLYDQRGVSIHILVRDDGSEDKTINVLQQYQQQYGKMTIIVENNVGCKRSFYKLLKLASELDVVFDYYAFCDQDDVWYKDKLLVAVERLDNVNCEYKLYHGAAQCVDANLNPLNILSIGKEPSLSSALISSHSLGCSQVFNRALLSKAVLIHNAIIPSHSNSEYLPQHDSWLYLTAKSLDGFIYYDLVPKIYYRQHANNVVGSGTNNGFLFNFISRLKRHLTEPNMRTRLALMLLAAYSEYIPDSSYLTIRQFAFYKLNIKNKIYLLFSNKAKSGNFSIDLFMKIMVLLGKY